MALSIEEICRKNRENDYDITLERFCSIQEMKPTKEICRNCGSEMKNTYELDEESGNDLYYIYKCTNKQCEFENSILHG